MAEILARNASSTRLLARNAFLELVFDPGPGDGNVIVSAIVQDPKFIKREKDPETGARVVTQQASVKITVVSPSGVEVFSRDVSELPRPNIDSRPQGFSLSAPVEAGSWRCIVRNTGPSEISCTAKLTFSVDPPNLIRTKIATRILNSAFSQVVDAIGLGVRIDSGNGTVSADRELFALMGGITAPELKFPAPVGSDINLASLGVKAVNAGGRPALLVLIDFETVGDTEISYGVDFADITKATVEVLVVLNSEGGTDSMHIKPTVSSVTAKVGVDLTVAGKVAAGLLRVFGITVEGVVDSLLDTLKRTVNSSEYLGPVGEYLTEAFVQLAQRGHKFHRLEVSGSDFVVVHFDPKAPPGKPGGVIDDSVRPADPINEALPPRPKRSTEFVAGLEHLNKIETIVVLMQENRSFDHMLGYLSLPGGNRRNGQPIEGKIDGLAGTERNDAPGDNTTGINALLDTQFPNSPAHELDNVLRQIDNGKMSGFLADFMDRYRVSVADTNPGRHTPLSHYTAKLLPVHDALARRHLVCDRWFAALPGATQPNRFCTLTGSTPVLGNFPISDPVLGYLRQQTVFDRLIEAGIDDWCYYEHDLAFLRFYNRYRLDNRRVVPFGAKQDGFAARAQAGTLPRVVFIDPNFVDVPPVRTANDDHPPADVASGQAMLAFVHDTLLGSPQWAKSMLIVTYDEHGGFFDHVPPPGTAASPAVIPRVHQNGPQCLGVRVPTFVVSPMVPAGGVSHIRFDHTSIAWTILLRFLGSNATPMSERMARSNHLGMVLDPAIRKNTKLIGPQPRPKRPPRDKVPPGGSIPILLSQPDTSRDFHEAVRRFGRPIIRA
jgi:phospholipase C